MGRPIDARCASCGATFPRSEAATETEGRLACPACGCPVVRGIPPQHTDLGRRVNARCGACGSTFAMSEATTEVKGELACPDCGAAEVRGLDADPP